MPVIISLFSPSPFSSSLSYDEKGSILITVAIFSVTLLILAALSVDTSMLTLANNMQQQNAERFAQAGLNAWKTSNKPTETEKIQVARDRVKEILDEAFVLFETNPNEVKTVGDSKTNYANAKYGKWFFTDPGCKSSSGSFNPSDSCPCPKNIFTKPCFKEMTASEISAPGETINAYQVTLESTETNPIKTAFARIFGRQSVKIKSVATSAVYPKNIIFLLDLSRSSFSESHFDINRIQNDITNYPGYILERELPSYDASIAANNIYFASDYAFKCGEASSSSCVAHINNGTENFGCEAPGCNMNVFTGLDQNTLWNSYVASSPGPAPNHGTRRGGAYSPFRFKHFVDDYALIPLAESATYGAYYTDAHCQANDLPGLFVGYSSDCGPENFGPEPLSSMLRGVKHGLNQLQPFDKISLIGFDLDARNYQRRFHSGVTAASGPSSTASVSGAEISLPANESLTLEPIMESLHQALDVEARDPNYFLNRVQNHHFIPLGEDELDVPAAINEALILLKNSPEFENSENQIILISDGMTNCISGVCGSDYASHANSLSEVKTIINDELLPANIEFHFIQVGEDTGAHKLLRRGIFPKERECLSQDTLKAADLAGKDLADLPTLVNNCSTCKNPDTCGACSSLAAEFDLMALGLGKYYGSSSLYTETLITGGTYKAVLPPCDHLNLSAGMTLAECQAGNYEISLDTKCASSGKGGSAGKVITDPKVTDKDGRIICEPSCKTKSQQIKEQLDKILEDSSYLTVE